MNKLGAVLRTTAYVELIIVVAVLAVLSLFDLRYKSINKSDPEPTLVSQADGLIYNGLNSPVPEIARSNFKKAFEHYDSLPQKQEIIRREIVVSEALLKESGLTSVCKLSNKTKESTKEKILWIETFIVSNPKQSAINKFISESKKYDIGVLRYTAISELYSRSKQPELAEKWMQKAKNIANKKMLVYSAFGLFMLVFGGVGILLLFRYLSWSKKQKAKEEAFVETNKIQTKTSDLLLNAFIYYIVAYSAIGIIAGSLFSMLSDKHILKTYMLQVNLFISFISIAIALFFIIKRGLILDRIGISFKAKLKDIFGWVKMGIGAYCVTIPLVFIGAMITRIFANQTFSDNPIVFWIKNGKISMVWIIFLAVIAAPVVEEIAFRGLLYTSLRKQFNKWGAAIISASIFSLIHPTIPYTLLPIFMLGMVFAIVREESNSIYPSMIAHALNNGISLLIFSLIQ